MTIKNAIRNGYKLDVIYEKDGDYAIEMKHKTTDDKISFIEYKDDALKIFGKKRIANHLVF